MGSPVKKQKRHHQKKYFKTIEAIGVLKVIINIIDWNFQEDLSRIRTGYGPENITRLRRFAISNQWAVNSYIPQIS